MAVKALNAKSSDPVPGAVKAGLRHFAIKNAQRDLLDIWLSSSIMLPLLLFFLGLFWDTGTMLADQEGIPHWYIAASPGLILALVIQITVLQLPAKIGWSTGWLLAAGLCTGALLLRDPSLNHPWYSVMNPVAINVRTKEAAYAMLIATVFLICMELSNLGMDIVNALTVGRHFKRHPEALLLLLLLLTRSRLSLHPTRMRNPKFKTAIIGDLEYAATLMENDMPQSISLKNDALRGQLQESFASSAAALRGMELRLAFSDDSTMRKIRDEVTDFIYAIATGDYALLPTAPPLPSPSKARKIGAILKEIFVALIPLTVLTIVRYVGVQVSAGIANWATVVSLIWAIVIIISVLDPRYKSKIADVKDVMSIIRGSGS
jgi:hypothetical protein